MQCGAVVRVRVHSTGATLLALLALFSFHGREIFNWASPAVSQRPLRHQSARHSFTPPLPWKSILDRLLRVATSTAAQFVLISGLWSAVMTDGPQEWHNENTVPARGSDKQEVTSSNCFFFFFFFTSKVVGSFIALLQLLRVVKESVSWSPRKNISFYGVLRMNWAISHPEERRCCTVVRQRILLYLLPDGSWVNRLWVGVSVDLKYLLVSSHLTDKFFFFFSTKNSFFFFFLWRLESPCEQGKGRDTQREALRAAAAESQRVQGGWPSLDTLLICSFGFTARVWHWNLTAEGSISRSRCE